MEGPRRLHHRPPRRPAQLLHPEDPAGHCARRRRRAQPDVRRPRRLPLQAGPVHYSNNFTPGEAARRPNPDGGLSYPRHRQSRLKGPYRRVREGDALFPISGLLLLATLATPAAAQEREVPYWATLRSTEVNMRAGPSEAFPIAWVYRRQGLPVRGTGDAGAGVWSKIRTATAAGSSRGCSIPSAARS